MRNRCNRPRTNLLVTGAVLVVVAVVVSSCAGARNESGSKTGISRVGSPDQVEAKIHFEEEATSGMTRKEFCQARWAGPQVHQRVAAKVAVNPPKAVAGQRVFAVIENLGTTSLAYGVAPTVDQLVGGEWRPRQILEQGQQIVFPTISLELEPRARSTCLEVPVPVKWHQGLYRVGFRVEPWGKKEKESSLEPVGYFHVVTKRGDRGSTEVKRSP